MKILTVIGARPQFIKASVLSRLISKRDGIEEILVHTGQHFDSNMSEIFFKQMDIPYPKYNLEINNLSHGSMTGRMLEKIEEVLLNESPDIVNVYGDTNSTLAGALAASKLNIPISHIEAGLRSFNLKMPEEVNRILTDRISKYLFCPTENAKTNLMNEGFRNFDVEIINCGDIMYDAAVYFGNSHSKEQKNISKNGKYALLTLHRAENINDIKRLSAIITELNRVNRDVITIKCPLHPGTLIKIKMAGLKIDFQILPPLGYLEMVNLIKESELIVTDSGGLQKEAYFFSKYCVTLRDETEWTELLDAGVNHLVKIGEESISEKIEELYKKEYTSPSGIYGKGNAGEIILNRILS